MIYVLAVSTSLVAIVSAVRVVTREVTVASLLFLGAVSLSSAFALALLGAPYPAAVEALVGAALIPSLLLLALRRKKGPDPFFSPIPRARRLLGGTIAGLVFLVLAGAVRFSPAVRGSTLDLETVSTGTATRVGESLLGAQLVAFESLAALVVVSLLLAVRLAREWAGEKVPDPDR